MRGAPDGLWQSVQAAGARLQSVDGTPVGGNGSGASEQLPIEDYDVVAVQVRLVATEGSTLTYRQEADLRRTGSEVSVIWPPERTVCTLVDDCGTEGTYLPDHPEVHGPGVSFDTELVAD
mgnify:CR=1 FL=1